MEKLTKHAVLIKKILLKKGLENPFINYKKKINYKKRKILIAAYFAKIIKLLNLNLKDKNLLETPNRIADMYIDKIFSGIDYINFPKITTIKNTIKINEMIIIRNIKFTTICEHHFIIIDGIANITYIPENKLIGFSKINQIVHFFSSRPQIQERLTQQILITLQLLLCTKSVAVQIHATHFCLKARNLSDKDSSVITFSLGGQFQKNKNHRKNFFEIFNNHK